MIGQGWLSEFLTQHQHGMIDCEDETMMSSPRVFPVQGLSGPREWDVRTVEHAAMKKVGRASLRTELQLGVQLRKQSDMLGDTGV